MNLNRKCQNFHLTYKGHWMIPFAWQHETLGYCYEEGSENGQEHTHCIVKFPPNKISKRMLLDWWKEIEGPGELRIDTHKDISTIIGYHCGLGRKERCKELVMITPGDFDIDKFIRARIMKKAPNVFEQSRQNKIIEQTKLSELLDQGLISWKEGIKVQEFKELMKRVRTEKEDLPSFLPNPWGKVLLSRKRGKRRHYWIFSRQPDMGKSYHFARPLEMAYKVVIKTGEFQYWNIQEETQGIILDEYNNPKLKYSDLNQMCDGTFDYRIFKGGVYRLRDPLIIVLSNQSITDLYPYMNNLLYARFNEIELI